jgi:hypothetical protein
MFRAALLCSAVATIAAAQVPTPVQKPEEAVVRGCVTGHTLKVVEADNSGVYSDTFRLRGPKRVMKALTELEGSEVEITGTLKDSDGRMGAVRTKRVGDRTKITMGVREYQNATPTDDPEITVESFRSLNPHCPR